ncbi:DUF72 domain-containing protein [Paucibacter soli]|uniref:DUF72 domain-containing protein n=1 Tax=Paucibacter soli TaxID=3133433 RepID=UPI0030A3C285
MNQAGQHPIRVGTASWTDKSLLACGRFYPAQCKSAEARLRYYASQFPLVELDSSYYAMPAPSTSQLWAERTPPGFVMNVKAFRLFTGHQTSPTVLHKDIRDALPAALAAKANLYYKDMPAELLDELWRRFREALLPLRAAGKLGLVHFQFSPWTLHNTAGLAQLRECVARMGGEHTLSVEFRHRSWFAEAAQIEPTLALLRELGVVHTIVDEPQGSFANSIPAVWAITHPRYLLLRLHGRNTATWNIKGSTAASERFNYDYGADELRELAVQLRALIEHVAEAHVIFNNNMEDQGQRNARSLMDILQAEGLTPLRSAPAC